MIRQLGGGVEIKGRKGEWERDGDKERNMEEGKKGRRGKGGKGREKEVSIRCKTSEHATS